MTRTIDPEYHKGERVYLGRTRSVENEALHVERYRFALEHIRQGAHVIDAACGSGYGSELLATKADRVLGLDLNTHALRYAAQHHAPPNVTYRRADFNRPLDVEPGTFDFVVSFETLEHIRGQESLISDFHRVLKIGGSLILSSPDCVVSKQLGYRNQFHVNELSKAELIDLVGKYFSIDAVYGQCLVAGGQWRQPLLWLARMDVVNLRARMSETPLLRGLQKALRPVKVSEAGSNIRRVSRDAASSHVYVIVVATKVTSTL